MLFCLWFQLIQFCFYYLFSQFYLGPSCLIRLNCWLGKVMSWVLKNHTMSALGKAPFKTHGKITQCRLWGRLPHTEKPHNVSFGEGSLTRKNHTMSALGKAPFKAHRKICLGDFNIHEKFLFLTTEKSHTAF